MASEFTVNLGTIIKEFALEKINFSDGDEDIIINNTDVLRPALPLSGYYDHFDFNRLQIIGMVETSYLSDLDADIRKKNIDIYFTTKIPAVIVTRNLEIFPEMLVAAQKNKVPLLRTSDSSSEFMAAIIAFLNLHLAPRITRHGVLVEVYGEGILLLGESGVGKSETAIELVKRGHRLIADDAVEIKRVSNKTLVGTAPDIIRHLIELRGIGIVDVKQIFGMGSVKEAEKVDLIIQLEAWDETKMYDRMGRDTQMTEILGLNIPSLTIPVRPGRNLAIIIEVAAMNNRQKKMGYNAAEELEKRLDKQFMK